VEIDQAPVRDHPELRGMSRYPAHIGAAQGAEPLDWPFVGVLREGAEHFVAEKSRRLFRDCSQQVFLASEMAERRTRRNSKPLGRLSHRDFFQTFFFDQFDGCIDQRLLQIAVMIAAAGTGTCGASFRGWERHRSNHSTSM